MLNPGLFKALSALAEETNGPPPAVSNEGAGFTYSVDKYRGRYFIRPESGEQYHLNCPFCSDSRKRLYVHHAYGLPSPDPRIQGPMIDLAFCQNEQEKKPQLYFTLKDYFWALDRGLIVLDDRAKSCAVEAVSPLEQVPPSVGETVPLASMPDSAHYQYWVRRGYDPYYLANIYGACIPVSNPDKDMWKMVRSRTIFPYTYQGRTIMWQGRLNFDHADKFPPKWWYPGGTKKVLWNMDLALQFPVCIITEGITSGICAGPAAVAVGGKTLTGFLADFMVENWEMAMVMLDPDAGINRKPGEKDYQKMMVSQLKSRGMTVFGARWKKGDLRDPGDIGMKGCAELIRHSCQQFADRLTYL